MDGVICGHIHHAVVTEIDGVTYANCGEWVDECFQLLVYKQEIYADSDSDGRLVSTS
jgi:UDP-2,3-diacylglucosamine pyrophosphatase LpxH